MNTILLTAGVVALMAAVIGGGLSAFNIQMPVLPSPRVRAALGVLGIAFLVAAVVLSEDNTSGGNADQARRDRQAEARQERQIEARRKQELEARRQREAETRYENQVKATCSAVRRLTSRRTLAVGPSQNFDRDTTLSQARANFAAIRSRLKLLLDRSAPPSLRDQARVARKRANSYIRAARDGLNTFGAALPAYPTMEELQAAVAPLQEASDVAIARLEDAMTQLAGSDCSLLRS